MRRVSLLCSFSYSPGPPPLCSFSYSPGPLPRGQAWLTVCIWRLSSEMRRPYEFARATVYAIRMLEEIKWKPLPKCSQNIFHVGLSRNQGSGPPPSDSRSRSIPAPSFPQTQEFGPPAHFCLGSRQWDPRSDIQTQTQESSALTWRSAEGAQQKPGYPGRRENSGPSEAARR